MVSLDFRPRSLTSTVVNGTIFAKPTAGHRLYMLDAMSFLHDWYIALHDGSRDINRSELRSGKPWPPARAA
jgi:hypothetical protein